jgi:hypothetical protein
LIDVGILKFFKKRFLGANMESCLKTLTKLNEEQIEEEELFASIRRIELTPTKYEAVLALTTLNQKYSRVNQ